MIEASFSGSKSGLPMKFLDFDVELFEGSTERPGQVIAVGQERVPLRAEDAQIEFAVEERDFEPVGGRGIAMRLRDAMDDAFQTQPPQVVRRLRGRVGLTEQRFDEGPEVAIAESSGQMGRAGD